MLLKPSREKSLGGAGACEALPSTATRVLFYHNTSTILPYRYIYIYIYCKIPTKVPLAQIKYVNCDTAATRHLVNLTWNAQKIYIKIRKSIPEI